MQKNTALKIFFGTLLSILAIVTQAQAALVAPTLYNPSNGAIGINKTEQNFDWSSVSGATVYRIVVSQYSSFSGFNESTSTCNSTCLTATTASSSYAGFSLTANTKYYWRVRAGNSSEGSPWSSYRSFTTDYDSFPAPTLYSPANGATDISKTQQNFDWSSVSGANSYRIVVSINSSFSGFTENGANSSCDSTCFTVKLSSSSYAGFSLSAGTKYYWRARAGNTNTSAGGYWSSVWSFTTAYDGLPAPTLYSPANGATDVSKTVQNFDWSSVSGANSYRIVVSINSSFSGFTENGANSSCDSTCFTVKLSSSSYAGFSLSAGTKYYWRARAGNTNTSAGGYWSSVWSFTTAPENNNTPPTGNISSPAGVVQGNLTVTVSGTDVDGLKKVSVVFVPNGTPLVMCEDGTSNPCSGTSGTWTMNNVDPTAYGITVSGDYTLGLHIQDESNGNTNTLVDTQIISWSEEVPGIYLNVSDWAQEAADFMVTQDIVDDPPDHDLRGTSAANRAELATMIYRALGGGKASADDNFFAWYGGIPHTPFNDVADQTAWYYKPAVYLGNLFYNSDSKKVAVFDQEKSLFRAPYSISRAWSLKALLEAWNIAPLENFSAITPFSDVPISHPAAGYIYRAQEMGIVEGTNGAFGPDVDVNREDIFVLLYRLMDADANLENQTIIMPTPLAREDFAAFKFVREIGRRDEQPFFAGVQVPMVTINAGIPIKENVGNLHNIYTVSLEANIDNVDSGVFEDANGHIRSASPFAAWQASAGSFVDVTPQGDIPFSKVKWMAPVDFSPFDGSSSLFLITLYVGDGLGTEIGAQHTITIENDPASSSITPTVSIEALPEGLVGGGVVSVAGSAEDSLASNIDAEYGVLQVALSYSLDGGEQWAPIGETGVDASGQWFMDWPIPDIFGDTVLKAQVINNRGNHAVEALLETNIEQRLVISGTVVDSYGSAMIGVTVELSGGGVSESTVTDSNGSFLFSNDQGIDLQTGVNYDLLAISSLGNGSLEGLVLSEEQPKLLETITIQTIILDTTAPLTVASIGSGHYTSPILVALECIDNDSGCAQTYYTTDGSTPTTSSFIYSSEILVSNDTTLKFFSIDNAENIEAVQSEIYTFENNTSDNGSEELPPDTDSDGDGISDITEVNELGTDPQNHDTDGDGFVDSIDTCPLVSNNSQCDDASCTNQDCSSCCLNCTLPLPSESCQNCVSITSRVGQWSAENNAQDLFGNHDGMLVDGTSFDVGMGGQAFWFDGIDDYVEVPHDDHLNPGMESFTIELWLKTAKKGSQSLIAKEDESEGLSLSISPTGQLYYSVADEMNNMAFEGVANLADDVWHHLAMVLDRSEGVLKAYVDGKPDNMEQWPGIESLESVNPESSLLMSDPVAAPFEGSLDEITLYSRALSQEEITLIFQASAAGKCFTEEDMALSPSTSEGDEPLYIGGGDCTMNLVSPGGDSNEASKFLWLLGIVVGILVVLRSKDMIDRLMSNRHQT